MKTKKKCGAWMAGAVLVVLAGAATAQAPAKTSANPMRPGGWEVTTESSSRGKQAAPKTSVVCVDQGWIDEQDLYAEGEKAPIKEALSCKNEGYARVPGSSSWTTVCKLAGGGEARISFERKASAEAVVFVSEMKASVNGETKQLTMRTNMRRMGEQCPEGAAKLSGSKAAAKK